MKKIFLAILLIIAFSGIVSAQQNKGFAVGAELGMQFKNHRGTMYEVEHTAPYYKVHGSYSFNVLR